MSALPVTSDFQQRDRAHDTELQKFYSAVHVNISRYIFAILQELFQQTLHFPFIVQNFYFIGLNEVSSPGRIFPASRIMNSCPVALKEVHRTNSHFNGELASCLSENVSGYLKVSLS